MDGLLSIDLPIENVGVSRPAHGSKCVALAIQRPVVVMRHLVAIRCGAMMTATGEALIASVKGKTA